MTLVVTYFEADGEECAEIVPLPADVAPVLARFVSYLLAQGCTEVRVWETAAEYRAWWYGRGYTA